MNPKDKIWLGFGIPILIISCVFAYLALTNIGVKGDNEWSNNATLIAEVGVGIVVTLFVLMITKFSDYRMNTKISSVLDIVKEREKIQKEKEKQVYFAILSSFKEIQNKIIVILNEAKLYEGSEDYTDKKTHKDQIIFSCGIIKQLSAKTLDDPSKISLEFFNFDTLGVIKTISSLCKNEPKFSENDKTVNVSFCSNLQNMIEPIIVELNEKIGKEVGSEQPQLEKNIEEVSMSVSSDRTVYPLNSIMHMRANLAFVIKGEKIIFEVFNSKRKLFLSQTIDPEKHDYPELAKANIFQACFKMEGDEWKVGETYIVRATHSSSYAEDPFIIDQRMPVIQSDKSVYIIGSGMILTVIDPDADKDNQVAEYVGDREDSKLIIESPYGKIEGYRLRETGDSTGIFQGIIGILGIRKNGTVIPQTFDGKIIDKIQGTGIDDGFIGGIRGDEITISYKNSTNVVSLSVFISDFGAVVEMDQKVYYPTDKVYLTIVAPDLSLDSEKVDEIGQKPQSMIQIRTGADKLDNYKLIETGPDTRIFTGELQLIPINKKSSEQSESRGPNDGILGCNKEDFVEIVFTPFEDEPIIGRAIIRS